MPEEVEEVINQFREIMLGGIPALLQDIETAFLSFICVLVAVDALAGYRYQHLTDGERFSQFVTDYFPAAYSTHAANLYLFRCRMLHNFSPAHFSLVHAKPHEHLQPSTIGDTYLSDERFYSHMRDAAEKYFTEVQSIAQRQSDMLARLNDIQRGGSISRM